MGIPFGALSALLLSLPVEAIAQAPSASPPSPDAAAVMRMLSAPPTSRALRGGAYWVDGPISNAGFIVGRSGVIVIDAQISVPATKAMLAQIAALTSKPITTVILTHSDPDHINGLPAFARTVKVIAQEKASAEIAQVVLDPQSNGMPPPPGIKDYVPKHRVAHTEKLLVDGVHLLLVHTSPAHTDGDLLVFLPSQKLVFAGDLLTPAIGDYPGVHLEKHGSSLGWLKSVEAMLSLDANLFVSGHGVPLTRPEVEVRLEAAKTRRAEIQAMVAKHATLSEIKAAVDDMPLPGVAARFPTFTETTYQELTRP